MTHEQTYRAYFKIPNIIPIYCENCESEKNVEISVIEHGIKTDIENLIALCGKCRKYRENNEFSIPVLRYMHRIMMNKYNRMLR